MTEIAIEPKSFIEYERAVQDAGANPTRISPNVTGLIWTDYSQPEQLRRLLDENPQLTWVQLPFAGVDAFSSVLDRSAVRFTSAKGAYREPVAEHALALCLALGRFLPERVRATKWGESKAVSLYDSTVLVVGGGGIAQELSNLLRPFRVKFIVVRKHPSSEGEQELAQLDALLPQADFVVVAAALTEETRHLFNRARFNLMKSSAFLVNVARGPLVNTPDLIAALESGEIAGAALDVTEPEPLPEGHALWSAKNILITPHTADTREMVLRLFAQRIRENALAFQGRGEWVGVVDQKLGY